MRSYNKLEDCCPLNEQRKQQNKQVTEVIQKRLKMKLFYMQREKSIQ